VEDADQRAYCRAVAGARASDCGYIRDADLRAACRAEVR
jgi:hypothetical protein